MSSFSHYNICFTADEGYIKYAAVLIKSIIDSFALKGCHIEELPVHFHVLTNGIKKETEDKLNDFIKLFEYPCKLYIHIISDSFFIEKGIKPWSKDGKYFTFYRLFLDDFFNNEKVLFLDVDMVVFGDLRKLWKLELKQRTCAAVNDTYFAKLDTDYNKFPKFKKDRERKNKKTKKKEMLFKNEKYFNAGFLFLDIQKFKERKCKKKCFEFLERYETWLPDQDALNYAIPEDEVLWLPMEYNFERSYLLDSDKRLFSYIKNPSLKNPFEVHSIENYKEAVKNIQIVHFIGKRKPWHKEKGGKAQKHWVETAKQTPWWNEIQKGIEEEKLKRKNEKIAKNATKTTSLDSFM